VAAGLVGFEITWRADVFSGAPQASSAAKFGTVGINFRARKAMTEEEWLDERSSAVCVTPALATRPPADLTDTAVRPPA
jgi:hypothetical protein